MYQFAIVALLALAVVKVVDFIDGAIPALALTGGGLALRRSSRRKRQTG